jgi:hypothetical protein
VDFTTSHVPNVKDLHPALNGEGLLLRGWASDWREDRVGDTIAPFALDVAIKRFMATNPVLLYSHKLALPPIGKILSLEVDPARGLYVEAVMPRPAEGGFAGQVWESAKNQLLRAFSIGGKFLRTIGSKIVDVDLREISLCSVSINPYTVADSVEPTEVKALGDQWVPVASTINARINAVVRQHSNRRDLDLALLKLSVASMHARAAQLRQPVL